MIKPADHFQPAWHWPQKRSANRENPRGFSPLHLSWLGFLTVPVLLRTWTPFEMAEAGGFNPLRSGAPAALRALSSNLGFCLWAHKARSPSPRTDKKRLLLGPCLLAGAGGFEPPNAGTKNRCLRPLGYAPWNCLNRLEHRL